MRGFGGDPIFACEGQRFASDPQQSLGRTCTAGIGEDLQANAVFAEDVRGVYLRFKGGFGRVR